MQYPTWEEEEEEETKKNSLLAEGKVYVVDLKAYSEARQCVVCTSTHAANQSLFEWSKHSHVDQTVLSSAGQLEEGTRQRGKVKGHRQRSRRRR